MLTNEQSELVLGLLRSLRQEILDSNPHVFVPQWRQDKIALIGSTLAAVQAERRQGQPVPDWSQAPAWAQWWAMDSNGEAHWFGTQPEWSDMAGRWRSAYRVIRASNDIDARQTLQQRPAPPAQA